MIFIFFLVLGYFIGSIPTAVWLGKKFHGVDIREHGSKNAGATNTFRVLGKRIGWFVLVIDVFKGTFAALLPYIFGTLVEEYHGEHLMLQLTSSFSAVVGHVFPVFADFRGGKGVATSLGIIFGINPIAAGICLFIFLLIFVLFRFVSLGAISASLMFPLVSYYIVHQHDRLMVIFTIILSIIIVVAHQKNISRLLKGEENKMNLLKKKA